MPCGQVPTVTSKVEAGGLILQVSLVLVVQGASFTTEALLPNRVAIIVMSRASMRKVQVSIAASNALPLSLLNFKTTSQMSIIH